MADVELDGVTKIYAGGVQAVAPTNLSIGDGEFVVLVGPSGCGKSTLLRMIAGLETISGGTLKLDGKVVNNTPARDRDVAMVFQNYALYPHMTVRDNMAFALKMRHAPKAEIGSRVTEAAEMLGLTQYLERKPAALSGGQRQRVALGRAIVRHPKLFLFDEPLSNLDAKLRVSTRAELIRLHRRLKATMIYVTHDQTEAMSMGDRLVVLRDGTVQQVGTPLEIYNNPTNQFVAGFVGSPPMNFITCDVRRDGDSLRLVNESFDIPLDEKHRIALDARRDGTSIEQIVLGIRPEDIHERNDDNANREVANPFVDDAGDFVKTQVLFIEPLGSEVLATCALGDYEIVARLSPRTAARADAAIELKFDMTQAKLFEPATGATLG
ncbi:MAG: sn-glycerol-3-phosphate ABC transporter ATP-binding protein UgpC [Pyrinomonadaceae bacterium MAG19_C2-C3]|nr:sn-glycerol-3-phosphate ABC transporter ATP-binding protein UgpC [Pyrinomonadaceae bacterium MAG19_C2-C3]